MWSESSFPCCWAPVSPYHWGTWRPTESFFADAFYLPAGWHHILPQSSFASLSLFAVPAWPHFQTPRCSLLAWLGQVHVPLDMVPTRQPRWALRSSKKSRGWWHLPCRMRSCLQSFIQRLPASQQHGTVDSYSVCDWWLAPDFFYFFFFCKLTPKPNLRINCRCNAKENFQMVRFQGRATHVPVASQIFGHCKGGKNTEESRTRSLRDTDIPLAKC